MKKYYTLLILLLSFWGNAQNGITYQAVILNPNSEELPGADNSRLPLVNQKITLEFKILNATSTIDYQETINSETDEFGMVNVIIGTGTRKAGIASQFSAINWDGSPKTLIVALDPTGDSTRFIEISDQPFTYVPYALYAANGGSTGAQGPVGPAGNNGLDGKTVLNGNTNPSASIGTNGDFYINTTTNSLFGPKTNDIWGNGVSLLGLQGIQGFAGPQGTAGTNGTNGSNGNDGLSAYQIWLNAGNTGTEVQFLTALRGVQGSQGIQGIQGPIGSTGATGPQGTAGTNGSNGTNGLSAYQIWLNAGNTGTETQFLTALRGATGAQGPQGIQGIQGPIGPTGAIGPQGTAGTNGSNGTNGLSAYQIWINAGNTGTEAQFLTALRGATGAQGIQGIQGAAGTNGKNTLVNTTTEAAGANCVSGGTKIEVGIDANSDGILDSGEVNSSLTKYVCNGGSSNNTGGANNLVHGVVTLNTIGQSINWIVPNEVYIIEVFVNGSDGGKGGDALYVGCSGIESRGGSGGVYGTAKVILNVVPGDVITYYLGSNGNPGNDACNYGYGAIAMNGAAGETTLIYKNSILGMRIVGGDGGTRARSGGYTASAGSNGYLDMSGLLNNGFFAEEKVNPYSNQKQTIIIRY